MKAGNYKNYLSWMLPYCHSENLDYSSNHGALRWRGRSREPSAANLLDVTG